MPKINLDDFLPSSNTADTDIGATIVPVSVQVHRNGSVVTVGPRASACLRCRADGMRLPLTSENDTHTCAKLRGQNPSRMTMEDRIVLARAELDKARADVLVPDAFMHATADDTRPSRDGIGKYATPGFSAVDDTRIGRDESALREAGFALLDTVFTRGELVNAIGVETARAKRVAWELLPTAAVGCGKLSQVVTNERREDCTVQVSDLTMTPAGMMQVQGKDFAIEAGVLSQVFQRVSSLAHVSSPGGAMGDWIKPNLLQARVFTFNALCEQVADDTSDDKAAYAAMSPAAIRRTDAKPPKDPKMVLRTRLDGGGRRAVFAAVSERYAACDVNLLADACGKAALQSGGEIRADVFYDRRKCSISLLAHSDVKPETCGVGETFQVGVRLQTDDTGKGGIRVAVLAFRNRCRNYYIIDEAVIRLASLRHIGDPTRLAAEVADRLGVAFAKISHFTRAWDAGANKRLWTADDLGIVTRATSNLRAERGSEKLLSELLDNAGRKMSAATLRDELLSGAFRGLAERKILPIGARLMEDEMPLLIKAHDDSRNAGSALRVGASLPTYASVANAVSLYAHDMQSDRLDEIELETAAGRILSMAAPLPWVAHKDQRV